MHEFVSLSIKTAENSSWPRDIKDKVTWPKIEIIWFVTICLFTGKKKEKNNAVHLWTLESNQNNWQRIFMAKDAKYF